MLSSDAVALNGSRWAQTMRTSGKTASSASMWTACEGIFNDQVPGACDCSACRTERSYS